MAPTGIDPRDRELLLSTDPSLWLGRIIQLNQQPRYNNSLDAIALMSSLTELRGSNGRGIGSPS